LVLITPDPGNELSVSPAAAIRIVAPNGKPIGSIRLSDLRCGMSGYIATHELADTGVARARPYVRCGTS
jgi:hypothetical protein